MWMFTGDATTADSITEAATGAAVESFAQADDTDQRLLLGDGSKPSTGGQETTILFTGGTYGAQAGKYLFRVGMWTPATDRDDFLAWYEDDHLSILLEHPVWDGCRFIETATDEGCQFYVLHQMQDPIALESEERRRSRDTPWFHRLKSKDWFDDAFVRTLFQRTES
jgi:hypothetical protein